MSEQPTLLQKLREIHPDVSITTLRSWVKLKRILVNGEIVSIPSTIYNDSDVIELRSKPESARPRMYGVAMIYHDKHLIAINKTSGMLSVPAGEHKQHAMEVVKSYLKTTSVFPIHRIDRETSGLLLFALSPDAQEKMSKLFETHDIYREYIAIVEGRIKAKHGTIESYLEELPNYSVIESSESSANAKLAITHFEKLRTSSKFSYLKLKLETGRKHQIRVHMSNMGHPVVGDTRYGAIADPLKRLGLHSNKIEFVHPFTHKKLSIQAEMPRQFKTLGFPEMK